MTTVREPAVLDETTDLRRVCVLADRYLHEWQAVALENLVEETDVEISLAVINDRPDEDGYDRDDVGQRALDNPGGIGWHDIALFVDLLASEGPWALVLAERKLAWLLGMSTPRWSVRRPVDRVECLGDVTTLRCRPISDGGAWNRLPDDVVETIASESDVVIRFGFGLLRGRVLEAPKYGVLSFHPADIRRFRGLGPSQVFLSGHDQAGATLQRLSETVDAGDIVLVDTVDISDAGTLDEVEERVYELQASMLTSGIERLRDPTFTPITPARLAEYTPISKRRELSFALRVLAKNLAGRLRGVRLPERGV